jgi:adenylate kinase
MLKTFSYGLFCLASGDDEGKEGSPIPYDDVIIPEFILSLEASDDFIKDRIMNLPESAIADTKNAEEGK